MRKLYFYAVAAALLLASPAWSLSVTVDSLAFGASNTPDTDAGSNANTSVIQTIAAGGALADAVGASESAGVRYSANQWADGSFGNTQINLTHSYDITITVSANAGTVYDISIDDVSTVRTYRSQFRKIISLDGFPSLLARLRSKTDEIRSGRADVSSLKSVDN